MQIYIAQNGQQMGTFTLDDVNSMLEEGEIQATDLAWHQGLDQWQPLSTIAGVIVLPPPIPVNPPPLQNAVHSNSTAISHLSLPDGKMESSKEFDEVSYTVTSTNNDNRLISSFDEKNTESTLAEAEPEISIFAGIGALAVFIFCTWKSFGWFWDLLPYGKYPVIFLYGVPLFIALLPTGLSLYVLQKIFPKKV